MVNYSQRQHVFYSIILIIFILNIACQKISQNKKKLIFISEPLPNRIDNEFKKHDEECLDCYLINPEIEFCNKIMNR
jgi:hypothetical protein